MSKQSNFEKYQKGKYRQISIRFHIQNNDDMMLYHYLSRYGNKTSFLKELIRSEMWKDAYDEK